MLKKFLILCFCLGFMVNPAVASRKYAMDQCNSEFKSAEPEFEVIYNFGDLNFDNSKSTSELAVLLKTTYPKMVTRKINGLTQLMPYMVIESRVAKTEIDKYACYYPKHVRIVVGYKPTLYIRNDIKPDTCRFKVTMRHEQTHLDIGHLSLINFAKQIKERFPSIVQDVGVRLITLDEDRKKGNVSNQMNRTYKEQADVLFEKFVQEMTERQMRIDTAESYKDETKMCPQD